MSAYNLVEAMGPVTAWKPIKADAQPHPADLLDAHSVHLWLLRGGRDDQRLGALVARYCGRSADELQLRIGEHGKPFLHDHELGFNVSHSGDWTLLGLARGCQIGVDLEHARRVRRRSALLERCFTTAEQRRLGAGGDMLLLRYWAAKEALVKAIGRGIAYGLKQIEIGEEFPAGIGIVGLDGPAAPASRWQLAGLDPGHDGFAAVAHDGGPRDVVCFELVD